MCFLKLLIKCFSGNKIFFFSKKCFFHVRKMVFETGKMFFESERLAQGFVGQSVAMGARQSQKG